MMTISGTIMLKKKGKEDLKKELWNSELAKAMSLFVLSKVILIICITVIFQNAPPAYSAFTRKLCVFRAW